MERNHNVKIQVILYKFIIIIKKKKDNNDLTFAEKRFKVNLVKVNRTRGADISAEMRKIDFSDSYNLIWLIPT